MLRGMMIPSCLGQEWEAAVIPRRRGSRAGQGSSMAAGIPRGTAALTHLRPPFIREQSKSGFISTWLFLFMESRASWSLSKHKTLKY